MHKMSPKMALARRAWSRMFDFLIRTGPERAHVLARRGLTPNDSRALSSLDPRAGRSMRALADAWECDASYATLIVDRLESLGLAARRADPNDRRVKLVRLTAAGRRLQMEILEEFHRPPAALLELTREQLRILERALNPLPGQGGSASALVDDLD
jgi:DNA-binding MarR family transcriptional regulator